MALFSRRPKASAEDDFDDFDEPYTYVPPTPAPTGDLPPNRMRDWEIPAAYVAAAVVAVLAILELVVTKGKGAKSAEPYLPIISLVIIAAQAATVRLNNRLLTAATTVLSALAVFYDNRIPNSLTYPRLIGFFTAFAFAFALIQRQSRAQRALMPARGRRGAGANNARGGRQARGAKAAPEPTGIPASRRYTPPKPKVEPTKKRR